METDGVEWNEQTIRKNIQMPILAEKLDQISIKIFSSNFQESSNRKKALIISTIELEYAFGQTGFNLVTAKHSVAAIVGEHTSGHYRYISVVAKNR